MDKSSNFLFCYEAFLKLQTLSLYQALRPMVGLNRHVIWRFDIALNEDWVTYFFSDKIYS